MIRNLGQVAAIYIGSSAPRNTNLIWLDNTVVPFVFRAYDGSAWSEIATHKWVRAYVDGWLVTLPPRQLADDGDYMLINSNNVNYKITVKDFVKSAVGNPLDFKGIIRVSADFPNPSTLESGDMYVIITSPAGGTVTDPYSGKTFEDSEKIVWDEVTQSWESLGKIDITVDLTTSYSETEVTIHSSAGKETTIQGATDQLAGVMLPGQYLWLQALSNGSIVPGDPSPLTPLTPAHKHNYNDIINRLVSQQGTGESTIDPMSQKATTDALNLKFDKASVLQVSGAATDKVMSQKAVTDALKTLSDDFNNKLTNYLPLAGGTMKGNIRFPIGNGIACNDVAGTTAYVVLRTWNANNSTRMYVGTVNFPTYISSTASDLIHDRNGSSYLLWDSYNLTNPVTYTTNAYNHATLTNKDGQYFTYIKAGTNGLLPHSQVTLANGGAGFLGTSDQGFNAGYINHLYANKISFGVNGPYIIGSTSATQFLDANGGVQKVATGGLYVGPSYTSDDLSLVPANGIYSRGIIYIENGIGFRNSIWTNDLTPNKNYSGYLQVLDAYDANNAGGPTNYGTVLQVNSRNAHWANQLWFSGGAVASKNGLYYRHMSYNETTYGEWNRLLTNKDVNIIQTQSSSNPSTLPANQIFYSEIQNVAETPTTKGLLFSIQGDDEGIQLWASSSKTELYYRTKWASFGNWIKLATTSDLGNYLPLSGGTLSGNLTINTVGSTTFVINNNDTNGSETFMRVLRKGTASAAIGFRDSLGAYIYNYNSNKYLFIDNDGYARVGTTSGSTRLALITDIPTVSGYLPLSGGTLTGALTMSSRRNNVVVDVVAGIGNNWNEGAGALSIQIPNDNGQTPLILARRSGAAINTTVATERLLDMVLLDTGTIFKVGMSGVNALELEVTSFTNKVGIGKLFGKQIATTDQIPSIPSISISNSGSGNAVTSITASGHTLTVTKGATYLTSSSLDGYATQTWANGQFAPLSRFNTSTGYTTIKVTGQEFNFDSSNPEIYMNYRTLSGSTAVTKITWKAGGGANSTALCEGRWGNLYMNNNLVATQTWAAEKFPNKTGTGASGTWGINITGNAATATNSTQLGGTAASSYVKANDNISRLTNDSGYTTQEWVNSQNFVKSTSTKKVTDIQPVDALPATQASGVLYLVFG